MKKQEYLFPEMGCEPTFAIVGVEELAAQVESVTLSPSLTRSIAKDGVLNPIVIDANNRVLDGLRRLKAAIELGIETLPAITFAALSPAVTIATNACRSRNFAAEFKAYRKLKDGGFSLDEISEKTGLSKTQLKPFEKLDEKLSLAAKLEVENGKIGQTLAKKLCKFDKHIQCDFIIEAAKEDNPRKALAKMVEKKAVSFDISALPPALFDDTVTVLNILNNAKSLAKGNKALEDAIAQAIEIAGDVK